MRGLDTSKFLLGDVEEVLDALIGQSVEKTFQDREQREGDGLGCEGQHHGIVRLIGVEDAVAKIVGSVDPEPCRLCVYGANFAAAEPQRNRCRFIRRFVCHTQFPN